MLGYAERVIIVPGYGLAVAQAQHSLRELVDVLSKRDIKVDYAIHPVAGRMPGHMNVLLAEAQVPYEQLKEMDEINGDFKDADVVLVVGANDVVNPAAKTTPGAPIYGMPILNADDAKAIIFMKRSMRPGFAGIENELLFDEKTSLLFGDAKETMGKPERREGALAPAHQLLRSPAAVHRSRHTEAGWMIEEDGWRGTTSRGSAHGRSSVSCAPTRPGSCWPSWSPCRGCCS